MFSTYVVVTEVGVKPIKYAKAERPLTSRSIPRDTDPRHPFCHPSAIPGRRLSIPTYTGLKTDQMSSNACATCAQVLDTSQDAVPDKTPLPGRRLECCGRSICAPCLSTNPRYQTYCPYCQITSSPSVLPQGLREPPSYESTLEQAGKSPPENKSSCVRREQGDDRPPAYSVHGPVQPPSDKHTREKDAPDVLHFLTPQDSLRSLSLAYGVPIGALRKANNIYSDHLVQGRRTVLIPGEHYQGGLSLSPRPVEGEEEEAKKQKIRRWMVACKVSEYVESFACFLCPCH